MMATMSYCSK